MVQHRCTVQVVWQPVLVDFCHPDKHVARLPGSWPKPWESHHHVPEAVLDPPLINTKAACVERLGHAWSMLHTELHIGLSLMEV